MTAAIQWVDDPRPIEGAARARGVEQACPEVEVGSRRRKRFSPVVDGLTADLEQSRRLARRRAPRRARAPPGATPLLGRRGPEHEVFQFPTQASTQDDRSHRVTPLDPWCLDDRFYLSKNFLSGPDP